MSGLAEPPSQLIGHGMEMERTEDWRELFVPEFYSILLGFHILECNGQASFFYYSSDSVLIGLLALDPRRIHEHQQTVYLESINRSVK